MNSKTKRTLLLVLLTIAFIICSTLVLAISFKKSESKEVYADEPSAASSFTGGTGTSGDPYLISSPEELIKFRNIVNGTNGETTNLSACARLTQDIVFTGTNNWNTPIGVNGSWNSPSTGFQGIFDGGGYAIIGLNQTFDLTLGKDLALFEWLGGSSVIKNLTLRNGEFIHPGRAISGSDVTAGAVAGFFYSMINNSTASISNCHTINFNITNLGTAGSATHTAAIGINAYSGSSITKCSSSGKIFAASGRVGGIMAFVNSSTIRDCYSACEMEITGDGSIGGIVGFSSSGQSTLTLQRNHYYGTIKYDETTTTGTYGRVGGITGTVDGGNPQTFTSNYYLASSTYKGKGREVADTSGQTTAISTSDFKSTSIFTSAGWNFSNGNWIMGPKYPLYVWPVHYITLDNSSTTTKGSEVIYLKEEVAYYLEKTCLDDSQMTSAKGIIIPQRTNYSFEGYYTEENGAGVQIIGPEGKLTSIADTSTFEKDCTLYALWSLNHIHDWTYEASGNSITATCVNENCYVVDGLTLTLNAPTGSMVYDGNDREATITTGYDTEAFESPIITYYSGATVVDSCQNAGEYRAEVTFGGVTASVVFEILKADPIYTAPTNLQATYGDLLSSVALPAGWSWKNVSNTVGNAGNTENEAIYTPEDTTNYNVLTVNLSIEVAKANPTYTVPTNIEAPYGVKLEKVALPSGFSWMDSTLDVGTWGERTFKAKYIPEDTNNYNRVENIDVSVTVKWILVDPTQDTVNIVIDDGETKFDVNITVKVEVKTELSVESKQTSYANLAKGFVAKDEDISAIYGVKLIRTTNGVEEEIQPSDIKEGQTIKVSMAIPEELQGKEFRLLHIHTIDDIFEVSKENYSITADGKTLIIETDKLSEFAFVSKTENADNGFIYEESNSKDLRILWSFVAIAAVIVVCLLILLIIKRQKDDDSNKQKKELKEAENVVVENMDSQSESETQQRED